MWWVRGELKEGSVFLCCLTLRLFHYNGFGVQSVNSETVFSVFGWSQRDLTKYQKVNKIQCYWERVTTISVEFPQFWGLSVKKFRKSKKITWWVRGELKGVLERFQNYSLLINIHPIWEIICFLIFHSYFLYFFCHFYWINTPPPSWVILPSSRK